MHANLKAVRVYRPDAAFSHGVIAWFLLQSYLSTSRGGRAELSVLWKTRMT